MTQQDNMKNQLAALGNFNDQANMNSLRMELKNMHGTNTDYDFHKSNGNNQSTNYQKNMMTGQHMTMNLGAPHAGPELLNRLENGGGDGYMGQMADNYNKDWVNQSEDDIKSNKNDFGDPNLQRLIAEREQILNNGYDLQDPLVRTFDIKINEIRRAIS